VLSTFKTGGRISEVLELERDMFEINPVYINVYGMPLRKRSDLEYRYFPIKISEPLTKEFIKLFKNISGKFLISNMTNHIN